MSEVEQSLANPEHYIWRTELYIPNAHRVEERALYERHKPVVDAWLREFVEKKDPWIQSAEHAASSYLSYLSSFQDKPLDWCSFNAQEFVLEDLTYGWSMHMFGCYKVFYDQLLEALRRFVAAGLLDRKMGERYLSELESLREQYLEKYRPLTREEEAELAIVRVRSRTRTHLRVGRGRHVRRSK